MVSDPRRDLLRIFESALAAVHGAVRVRERLARERFDSPTWDIDQHLHRSATRILQRRYINGKR